MLTRARSQLIYALIVAFVWSLVYMFNEAVFAAAQLNVVANLIFLPAMIRPLAVLVFGGACVAGLFLGAIITFPLSPLTLPALIAVCAASSFPAWLALSLLRKRPSLASQLSGELAGLQLSTIFQIAILTAALSATSHYFAFWYTPQTTHSFEQLAAMFIGDALGSMLMLWFISIVLRGLKGRGSSA